MSVKLQLWRVDTGDKDRLDVCWSTWVRLEGDGEVTAVPSMSTGGVTLYSDQKWRLTFLEPEKLQGMVWSWRGEAIPFAEVVARLQAIEPASGEEKRTFVRGGEGDKYLCLWV